MAEATVKYNKSLREKARRIFGSEENYELFRALNKYEHSYYPEPPWQKHHQQRFEFEEEFLEQHEETAPFWMGSPFFLSVLPSGAIGIPEAFTEEIESKSSREYGINNGDLILTRKRWREDRLPRRDGVPNKGAWRDYSTLGWTPSDGDPVRLTSPEEHEEILRRLKRAGLQKSGSPMPVQGWTLTQLAEEPMVALDL